LLGYNKRVSLPFSKPADAAKVTRFRANIVTEGRDESLLFFKAVANMINLEELSLTIPNPPNDEVLFEAWTELTRAPLRSLHIQAPIYHAAELLRHHFPKLVEFHFQEYLGVELGRFRLYCGTAEERYDILMIALKEFCDFHRRQLKTFKLELSWGLRTDSMETSELLEDGIGELPLLETFAFTGYWDFFPSTNRDEAALDRFLRIHSGTLRSVELVQAKYGIIEHRRGSWKLIQFHLPYTAPCALRNLTSLKLGVTSDISNTAFKTWISSLLPTLRLLWLIDVWMTKDDYEWFTGALQTSNTLLQDILLKLKAFEPTYLVTLAAALPRARNVKIAYIFHFRTRKEVGDVCHTFRKSFPVSDLFLAGSGC
jgi:hypothetical protein